MLLLLLPPYRQTQIEAHEIRRRNGLVFMPVLSLRLEPYEGDSAILTGKVKILSTLRKNTLRGEVRVPPTFLLLPSTTREELWLEEYLDCPMPHRHETFANIHALKW
ncbi:hypothetical protein TNCV_2164521 [Trichonephila clavipes]|nr:hypothetical protein TNCV_2164521 [Trichonephila clavipes]